MNTNDLATQYRLLNSSFKKTMIYHVGIDAGFFTEYTYMIHAMLYCLQHKIQFKLYSDDANFGWEKGWEDCFVPFCEQVHESFHHTYNTHRLPSWKALMKDKKLPRTKLLKWKLKVTLKNLIGKILAFLVYSKPVLLNFQLKFNPAQHFHIPELGIDGDYLHTFQKLTEITWKLNDTTAQECRQLADSLENKPFPVLSKVLQAHCFFEFGGIEDHFKYRDAVMRAYPQGHFPVFEQMNHMQFQIQNPQGFGAMLENIIETGGLPDLPFLRQASERKKP
mgnify:CR=1 FL=1